MSNEAIRLRRGRSRDGMGSATNGRPKKDGRTVEDWAITSYRTLRFKCYWNAQAIRTEINSKPDQAKVGY